MPHHSLTEAKILQCWNGNAHPWTAAVREGRIESRRRCTDHAIVEAVLSRRPGSVLDLGCGEGWLARELSSRGIAVVGTDGVESLVEAARSAGGGVFHHLAYEEIAAGKLAIQVDAVVCNFSLIGKESVEELFQVVSSLLHPQGSFLVQTLHPLMACGNAPYRDGWREGSWAGFPAEFSNPAPWFFRTMESWVRLFLEHGLRLRELREPIHPATQQPASALFIAEVDPARP